MRCSQALELLEMHNNRLSKIDDGYFEKTPQLRRLVLTGNQLKSLPSSLTACSQLQFLLIGDNQISEISAVDGTGAVCWPELETLFVEKNPLSAVPIGLVDCPKLLRCNLTGTSIEKGDEAATALLKLTLARPGGNFWGVDGRRWMADEAKQASFALGQCVSR